jgi:hypothetical protein
MGTLTTIFLSVTDSSSPSQAVTTHVRNFFSWSYIHPRHVLGEVSSKDKPLVERGGWGKVDYTWNFQMEWISRLRTWYHKYEEGQSNPTGNFKYLIFGKTLLGMLLSFLMAPLAGICRLGNKRGKTFRSRSFSFQQRVFHYSGSRYTRSPVVVRGQSRFGHISLKHRFYCPAYWGMSTFSSQQHRVTTSCTGGKQS